MASNYTSNYSLCQWTASDKVLRTEFNADNAKIDAALAGKASVSALDSLRTTVNGKADKSSVTSLSSTVTSQGTELAARNCKVYMTSYTGTGANTRTFSFPAKPWLVIFFRDGNAAILVARGAAYGAFTGSTTTAVSFTWSGNSVTATQVGGGIVNAPNSAHTIVAFLEP